MYVENDIRTRNAKDIIVALELTRQALETLTTEIILGKPIALYHRAHRSIEHKYFFLYLFVKCCHVFKLPNES